MEANNEIDLWELVSAGFNFFKRKRKIILIFFLAGLLYGIAEFFLYPLDYKSYYKKEYSAESSVVSNEALSDIINALPCKLERFPEFRNIKGAFLVNVMKR